MKVTIWTNMAGLEAIKRRDWLGVQYMSSVPPAGGSQLTNLLYIVHSYNRNRLTHNVFQVQLDYDDLIQILDSHERYEKRHEQLELHFDDYGDVYGESDY